MTDAPRPTYRPDGIADRCIFWKSSHPVFDWLTCFRSCPQHPHLLYLSVCPNLLVFFLSLQLKKNQTIRHLEITELPYEVGFPIKLLYCWYISEKLADTDELKMMTERKVWTYLSCFQTEYLKRFLIIDFSYFPFPFKKELHTHTWCHTSLLLQ